MPSLCCVPGCNNRGGHVFPKSDTALKDRWIQAIKRVATKHGKKWRPKAYMLVCKSHFTEEDYTKNETFHGELFLENFL